MPTSYARVPTDRAARHLKQLCSHTRHVGRLHGTGDGPAVTSSGTDGLIDFGWARCTLKATPDALHLTAESPDPAALARLTTALTQRLPDLQVHWTDAG